MENRTGVYYQAMPAVGPDGKNVMKLIPVQKVNGLFVRTQVLGTKKDTKPKVYSQLSHISLASSPQNRFSTLQAIGDGRFILKTPPEGNTLVNSGESRLQEANALFTNPIKEVQITPKMTHNLLQSPDQNKNIKGVTVVNSPQLPITVKSPILPSGYYLQIPPNATVRTLPATALPQSIKKQIWNFADVPSDPVKGLPTVLYVSPVNSLQLGDTQQLPCLTKSSELPQTLSYSPTTSSEKDLDISSTSNSKTTQGVTTPMKWVVQEGTGCTAPRLIPVTSPNMTSDILKAVKEVEAARLENAAGEPTSTTSQEKVHPGKDNALVMYNGKVYFVAKKDSEITKDVIAGVESRLNIRKSAQPSSTTVGSCTSNMAQKKVSKAANEIIDLCGDDEETCTSAGSDRFPETNEMGVQNDDDSNVIFVSYIPPKSESETSHKITEEAPHTCQKSEKDVNSPGGYMVDMDKDFKGSSTSITGTNLDLKCEDNALEREGPVPKQLKTICSQETDITERDSDLLCRLDTEAVSEVSSEKQALDQVCRQKSDSELRQMFGITSDLRVCLQRVELTKKSDPQAKRRSINKRTLEGIRRIICQSQAQRNAQCNAQRKHVTQAQVSTRKMGEKSSPRNAKRQKLEQDGQTPSHTTLFVNKDSLPESKDLVKCDKEVQSVPTVPCVDSDVSLTCPKEEKLSCADAYEGAHQTTESSCLSSSLQPSQTPPERSCAGSGACTPASRKTLPRVRKGSGRMCTACPCGTKVGAVSAGPLSKQEEKSVLPAVVDSCRGADGVSESNGDCRRCEKVVESSISSFLDSSGVLSRAGDEEVHSSPADVSGVLFDGTGSPSSRPECVGKLDASSEETTHGSSEDVKLGETFKQDQLETAPLEPHALKKADGKLPSSSVGQVNSVGDGFPFELFSSLVLDPEEVKRQERIKRLKDILREKEAALKKLRQSM